MSNNDKSGDEKFQETLNRLSRLTISEANRQQQLATEQRQAERRRQLRAQASRDQRASLARARLQRSARGGSAIASSSRARSFAEDEELMLAQALSASLDPSEDVAIIDADEQLALHESNSVNNGSSGGSTSSTRSSAPSNDRAAGSTSNSSRSNRTEHHTHHQQRSSSSSSVSSSMSTIAAKSTPANIVPTSSSAVVPDTSISEEDQRAIALALQEEEDAIMQQAAPRRSELLSSMARQPLKKTLSDQVQSLMRMTGCMEADARKLLRDANNDFDSAVREFSRIKLHNLSASRGPFTTAMLSSPPKFAATPTPPSTPPTTKMTTTKSILFDDTPRSTASDMQMATPAGAAAAPRRVLDLTDDTSSQRIWTDQLSPTANASPLPSMIDDGDGDASAAEDDSLQLMNEEDEINRAIALSLAEQQNKATTKAPSVRSTLMADQERDYQLALESDRKAKQAAQAAAAASSTTPCRSSSTPSAATATTTTTTTSTATTTTLADAATSVAADDIDFRHPAPAEDVAGVAIRFTLPDGRRVVARFATSATVQDVRSVIRQKLLNPEYKMPFALRIPMSNVDFADRTKTLKDLGLTSAAAITVVEV